MPLQPLLVGRSGSCSIRAICTESCRLSRLVDGCCVREPVLVKPARNRKRKSNILLKADKDFSELLGENSSASKVATGNSSK
jgi:hypothetical protein